MSLAISLLTLTKIILQTGLVDEIIGDTLDSMVSYPLLLFEAVAEFTFSQDEGLETEADKEAERIVAELTADILAPAGAVPQGPIKKPSAVEEVQEEEVIII